MIKTGFLKKIKDKTNVETATISDEPQAPPAPEDLRKFEADDFGSMAFYLAQSLNDNASMHDQLTAIRHELAAVNATLKAIQKGG